MITIKDFLETIQYKITEGSEYLWECYGENARTMDYWNGKTDTDGRSVYIVFDTETQIVYQMEAWDQSNDTAYRWIHPDYLSDIKAESINRGIDFEKSIDDKKFIDLEVEEDILAKAAAMVSGEEYDKRVMITLKLAHEEEHLLMQLAHNADVSLNEYVNTLLTSFIGDPSVLEQ